jgi:hypothetical protein
MNKNPGHRILDLLRKTPLVLLLGLSIACERHTTLSIQGGTIPTFKLTGSGDLFSVRLRGPKKQREAIGEDAAIYWEIRLMSGQI